MGIYKSLKSSSSLSKGIIFLSYLCLMFDLLVYDKVQIKFWSAGHFSYSGELQLSQHIWTNDQSEIETESGLYENTN